MKKSKISIVLPDLRGGGAERVSLDLALAIAHFGYAVEFVLMSSSGSFLPEALKRFDVFDLGVAKTRHVPRALADHLRHTQPDCVIANMWPLTSAAVIGCALSGHRCKLLLVDHSTLSQQYSSWGAIQNWVLRTSIFLTYRMADAAAGVSTGVAEDLARLARAPKGSFATLYNPIPQCALPAHDARERAEALWGARRGKRVLTVGNLKNEKNHLLLLHAFARMDRPSDVLMLVGHGQAEPMLRALALDLGIVDRVVFAGFHTDPSAFYATADLFVLSSDYEGFGNVIVEALSFGLPVVSTDCPSGPAEILENGRWGRLTPVGDAEALARAMDEALSTPVDREALKRRAADFSPEIAARKYLDLLGLS